MCNRQVAQQRRCRHRLQHVVTELHECGAGGGSPVLPGGTGERGTASNQRTQRRCRTQGHAASYQIYRSTRGCPGGSAGKAGFSGVDRGLNVELLFQRVLQQNTFCVVNAVQAQQLGMGVAHGALQAPGHGGHRVFSGLRISLPVNCADQALDVGQGAAYFFNFAGGIA